MVTTNTHTRVFINITRWRKWIVKSNWYKLYDIKTSPEMWQIVCWYKCSVSTINQAVPLCPEANHSGITPRRALSGKLAFKTHTQENRPRTAVVNHMCTKDLWRIKKRNVCVITNKHTNNYGIFQSNYCAQGIVLVCPIVIINVLYHIIKEKNLSLFWMTIKVLPCCNYCYWVTSLFDICPIYCTQNRHEINIESRFD